MFFLFWRKRRKVEELLNQYFEATDTCFDILLKGMEEYVTNGLSDKFGQLVEEIHETESQADALRRDIEMTLYGQSLLPESRGDLLGLLEQFDRIPNRAETCLYIIQTQYLEWPKELGKDLLSLVKRNVEAYKLTRKAVDVLFHEPKKTLYTCKEVDIKESESDREERELISHIFGKMDCEVGYKILYKELILCIGNISDRCETTADRISIIAIKRQI